MAIKKLTYNIKVSRFIKLLYPIWLIQSAFGSENFYMPNWAFKMELDK